MNVDAVSRKIKVEVTYNDGTTEIVDLAYLAMHKAPKPMLAIRSLGTWLYCEKTATVESKLGD